MALQGAYLHTAQDLTGPPETDLLTTDDGTRTFAVVNLGQSGGTYVRVHSAAIARELAQAFITAAGLLENGELPGEAEERYWASLLAEGGAS